MTEQARSTGTSAVVALLTRYSFDTGELTIEQLADQWLQAYPAHWVHLALVEALYQGRYKAVSVAQILAFWQRRDQPLYRFDLEFEQLICNRLPKKLSTERQPTGAPTLATEEVHSCSKAHQVGSNAIISPNPSRQDKTIQNPLPTQARASSSSLSLPKIASGSLSKTTRLTIGRKDSQVPQSLDPRLLSNAGISKLDKVLSSRVEVEADQSKLKANSASQTVWSELEKYPILQFTPDTEASSFQIKLSAIAQGPGTRIALAERGDRSR